MITLTSELMPLEHFYIFLAIYLAAVRHKPGKETPQLPPSPLAGTLYPHLTARALNKYSFAAVAHTTSRSTRTDKARIVKAIVKTKLA